MIDARNSDGFVQLLPTGSTMREQAVFDHLASGCIECSRALSWLSRQGLPRGRRSFPSPPDYAVEAVKDAFLGFARLGGRPIARRSRWAPGGLDGTGRSKEINTWLYQEVPDPTLIR